MALGRTFPIARKSDGEGADTNPRIESYDTQIAK
jgi:hypothetical protein